MKREDDDMRLAYGLLLGLVVIWILVKTQALPRFAEWAAEGKVKFVKRK